MRVIVETLLVLKSWKGQSVAIMSKSSSEMVLDCRTVIGQLAIVVGVIVGGRRGTSLNQTSRW